MCLHNRLKVSTLFEWTGSLWIGVASAVLSGKVHRWKAPGLEWSTCSTSGPASVDEKGDVEGQVDRGIGGSGWRDW
jgi:hypothetical protein